MLSSNQKVLRQSCAGFQTMISMNEVNIREEMYVSLSYWYVILSKLNFEFGPLRITFP